MSFRKVLITDNRQTQLYRGTICMLPLRESKIAEYCEKYYPQMEICIIRRENIKRIIYLEIEEAMLEIEEENDFKYPIPEYISQAIDFKGEQLYFQLLEDGT